MVDIPLIQRESQEAAIPSAKLDITVPETKDYLPETISKVFNKGVKLYKTEMERAANDFSRKASNEYRNEFNTAFNVGHGEEQGLKHIEGYDQFVVGRDKLMDKIDKKRQEILSNPELSELAKQKTIARLEDDFSTFKYYLDVQEGQVKLKDRAKNIDVEQNYLIGQTKEMLSTYTGSEQSKKTVDFTIRKMEDSLRDGLVDLGLGSKEVVLDKSGKSTGMKYSIMTSEERAADKDAESKMSNVGQFEFDKKISENLNDTISEIAVNDPIRAVALFKRYGNKILPDTRVRLEKIIKKSSEVQAADRMAMSSIINKETPQQIRQKQKELVDSGKIEVAKLYYQTVLDQQNKNETLDRNFSQNSLYRISGKLAEHRKNNQAKTSEADALKDPDILKDYLNLLPEEQTKFKAQFKAPATSSFEALDEMDKFIESGVDDDVRFNAIWADLSQVHRNRALKKYKGVGFVNVSTDADRKAVAQIYRSWDTEFYKINGGNKYKRGFYFNQNIEEEKKKAEEAFDKWINNQLTTKSRAGYEPESKRLIRAFLEDYRDTQGENPPPFVMSGEGGGNVKYKPDPTAAQMKQINILRQTEKTSVRDAFYRVMGYYPEETKIGSSARK